MGKVVVVHCMREKEGNRELYLITSAYLQEEKNYLKMYTYSYCVHHHVRMSL